MSVENKNGSLFWATGIDNSGLKQDADEAKGIIKGMSGDITNISDSTSDAIDKIGKSAIESAKAQISTQKDIIKQIESDIKNIESQANKAAPGNAKSELISEVNAAKQALAEEKAVLAGLEQQVTSVAEKHGSLRSQIFAAREALSQMEMQGKRNTPEFEALRAKLGELNDQFKDTSAQATILADDQRGFQAITQSVSGMAGAMSAATGIAALFGAENEDLAKVQARLQAVMAITIGLQQVSEMLNKDSYFSVVLLSKGKELLAASELKLATAIGVSTAAARTFMIATGAIAIVGLIALVAAISKVSEAHKEQTKTATDAAKKEQEASAEIASGYAKEKSKIDSLMSAIHSENVSRENKLKMIKQLKDMIPGYTAELSKEGTVIRENKKAIDEYMISLEKSLKLKAAEKELEAIYTKMYKLEKLSNTGEKQGNQFTKNLADQDQGGLNQTDIANQNAKKGIAKGAKAGVAELQKEADTIKEYISKTGLVSEAVIEKVNDKAKKAAKEQYNATKDLQALLLDINQQTNSLLLDQQADSLQKRLALIDAEKQAELQAIKEKEIKIIEEYNKSNKDKKGFKSLSTKPEDLQASLQTINPDLAKQLQTATTGVVAAYGQKSKQETKKWNDEILDLAREFADKRVQIAYDYNEKIAKLEGLGQKDAANAARKERDKAISDETMSIIENTQLYKTASDERLNISKATTRQLLDDLRQRLVDEWAAGNLSVEKMNEMMDKVNNAQKAVSDNKNQNNPFALLGSAISGQKTAKSDYKAALADPTKTTEDLAALESAANESTKAMAGAAGAALQGAGSILQSVIGGLDELGLLTENQKKDAENVMGMVDGAANIAMGIATGNPMAIIQGSIDLLVSGYKLFDTRTKDAEKTISEMSDKVDRLKDSYNDLSDAIDAAFSTKKASLIKEQIANLQEQNEAIKAQMAAENSKKNPDDTALKEYQDQIKENNKLIQDQKDSWIEALTGTDVMSAVDSFAQAYADAWTSGENAAKKSTEVVKGIIRNGLIEYMKGKLQPEVESLMNSIATAMTDGSISKSEQDAIDVLTNSLDAKAAQYKTALDPYLESSTKSGVTGELKSAMTEGTGSQLVGLWNMTAMDIRWIREWLAAMNSGGNTAITGDVGTLLNVVISNTWLIQQHTQRTADGVVYIAGILNQVLYSRNNNTSNNNNSKYPNTSRESEL